MLRAELRRASRLRKHAANAHDGDRLARRLAARLDDLPAPGRHRLLEDLDGALADIPMQGFHGPRPVDQRGQVADHEHSVLTLFLFRGSNQPVAMGVAVCGSAFHPFRGQPQSAQVQRLQLPSHLIQVRLVGQQLPAATPELLGKGRRCAAGRVPQARLQQRRFPALNRLPLVLGRNRACGYRLFREQVAGADHHADLDSPFDERGPHGGGHRRGMAVVDASSKENVDLGRVIELGLQQRLDCGAPQGETTQRPDVAAALAAFENELAQPLRAGTSPADSATGREDRRTRRAAPVPRLARGGRRR